MGIASDDKPSCSSCRNWGAPLRVHLMTTYCRSEDVLADHGRLAGDAAIEVVVPNN